MATDRQRQAFGAYGERVAARYLTGLGFTVLDRNWRCRAGEIDLVLRDVDTLVICEVKTRRGATFAHPLSNVRAEKAARLRRLALLWVGSHDVRSAGIRIDLVSVVQPLRGPAVIEHVRGIG